MSRGPGRPPAVLKIEHVPEGESGRVQKLSEDRAKEFAELVASGNLDEKQLSKQMGGIGVLAVRKALRSTTIRAIIREEIEARQLLTQAKAAAEMDCVLDQMVKDVQHKSGRIRVNAAKFVRDTARGPDKPLVNQNNNIAAWDPMQDEELWQRGREFFENNSMRIAVQAADATVKRVLEIGSDE
jgi:hypothetical protein